MARTRSRNYGPRTAGPPTAPPRRAARGAAAAALGAAAAEAAADPTLDPAAAPADQPAGYMVDGRPDYALMMRDMSPTLRALFEQAVFAAELPQAPPPARPAAFPGTAPHGVHASLGPDEGLAALHARREPSPDPALLDDLAALHARRAPRDSARPDGPVRAAAVSPEVRFTVPPPAESPTREEHEAAALESARLEVGKDESDDEGGHLFQDAIDSAGVKADQRARVIDNTYFYHLWLKTRANDTAHQLAVLERMAAVRKAERKAAKILLRALPAGPIRAAQAAALEVMSAEYDYLKGQIATFEGVLQLCSIVDETYDPATLWAHALKRWAFLRRDPFKFAEVVEYIQQSKHYSDLLKKPKDYVAPREGGFPSTSGDGLPGGPAATSQPGPLGKGGKGGAGFKGGASVALGKGLKGAGGVKRKKAPRTKVGVSGLSSGASSGEDE